MSLKFDQKFFGFTNEKVYRNKRQFTAFTGLPGLPFTIYHLPFTGFTITG
jgi:hypothetical protein